MKRLLLLSCLIISTAGYLQAQNTDEAGKNFYLHFGLGYGFAQAGGTFDNGGFPYNGTISNQSNGDLNYNVQNASFSAGLHGELGLGYMFNPHIGIELGLDIGFVNTAYTGSHLGDTSGGVTYNYSQKQYAQNPVLLVPGIIIKSGSGTFNFYARAGLVLPLVTKFIQEQTIANLPGNGAVETDVLTYAVSNKFVPGFRGSVGVEYKLGGNNYICAELQLLSMSLYPSGETLTAVSVNGVAYPTTSVSTTYQSVTIGNNITIPAGNNSGTIQPAYAIPFSHMGIHIGMVHVISSLSHGSNGHGHKVVRHSW
jgi:hypothetical protein